MKLQAALTNVERVCSFTNIGIKVALDEFTTN